MRRRLKTMIFWLLFAALPAQGLATATMLFCDAVPPANREARVAVMAGGYHHAAVETNAGAQDLTEADHLAQNHCQGSAQGSKCAGCTAYCSGTLMMPAIAPLPPLAMRDIQSALPDPVSSPGPDVEGLFRPPRSILA
jgi:hypothetical protein